MSSSIVLNRLKLTIFAVAFLILLSFVNRNVFSQSPAPSEDSQTTTSGLNFPIEELGGCTDLETCTNYCQDPVNYNSCSDFAKKNGFYKDDQTLYADDEFWQETQNELGCNSTESCESYCANPDNFEQCDAFAKRNEIPGGYTDQPDKPEYLQIAQNVLGCNSIETCSTFCDNPANASVCTNFANQVGLLGGTETGGPGGCNTPDTCSAYCSDPANYSECSSFAPGGGTFTGPGGCASETACRNYCDQNPKECRAFAPGSNGAYVPIECPTGQYHGPGGVCTAVGDTQAAAACVGADRYWTGTACIEFFETPIGIYPLNPGAHFEERPEMDNCTTPGTCYDFCVANPTSPACQGFDPSASRPTRAGAPAASKPTARAASTSTSPTF